MDLKTDTPNPADIVAVHDLSPQTLLKIIAVLDASTDFEHLVYREAELDALWSVSGFLLSGCVDSPGRKLLSRLHECAQKAHDLVAAGQANEAADQLRRCL